MNYVFLGQILAKLQNFKFLKTGLFLWFNIASVRKDQYSGHMIARGQKAYAISLKQNRLVEMIVLKYPPPINAPLKINEKKMI